MCSDNIKDNIQIIKNIHTMTQIEQAITDGTLNEVEYKFYSTWQVYHYWYSNQSLKYWLGFDSPKFWFPENLIPWKFWCPEKSKSSNRSIPPTFRIPEYFNFRKFLFLCNFRFPEIFDLSNPNFRGGEFGSSYLQWQNSRSIEDNCISFFHRVG